MTYTGINDDQKQSMLNVLGIKKIDDLFADIPASVKLEGLLDLPIAMDDMSLQTHLSELAAKNNATDKLISFMGGGSYDHYIPPVVDALANQPEFVTAYTPYQAEASQGALQAFYEFQSMICELTGMDVTNASMYEAGSALAEAILMSRDLTSKSKVLIGQNIHPEYLQVVKTYLASQAITLEIIPEPDGLIDPTSMSKMIDDKTAAVIVQQPNFLGCLNPLGEITESAHKAGALLIAVVDPISLGMLKSPGQLDADIVVGEGQPLGIPQNSGGPYLGLLAVKEKYMRRLPGRLVGKTTDSEGRPAFCLTLQTREQHIKRERATSNICSNEGLLAIRATIYLAAMGKNGFEKIANLCFQKAHYAADQIAKLDGYELAFDSTTPFFREFTIRCTRTKVDDVITQLRAAGILAGIKLGRWRSDLNDCLLIAVTEKRTKDQIDKFVEALAAVK